MYSRKKLDLTYRPRRHAWRRLMRRAAALLLLCAAVPLLRAALPAAPGWLQTQLAPAWAAEQRALEADNAALRGELAAAAALKEENTALRDLLGSAAPRPAALCPARALARGAGGVLLCCGESTSAAGAAVLDRRGRFAGRAAAVRGTLVWVPGPDGEACFVGEDPAVLRCAGDAWQVTGLPVPAGAVAGALVTTPEGLWIGRLAAAPTPEAGTGGLTAGAPLTDIARPDTRYFVAVEEEKGYNN